MAYIKKIYVILIITAIVLFTDSCAPNCNRRDDMCNKINTISCCVDSITERVDVYKGLFPAADCSGIEIVLNLDENNDTFSLKSIYLDGDGPDKDVIFVTKGKVEKIKQRIRGEDKEYIKLQFESDEPSIYFMIVNDSVLRMVNDSLQEIDSNFNYNIIKIKD